MHSTHPKIMLKTQCSFLCHCVFLYTKKPRSIRPRLEFYIFIVYVYIAIPIINNTMR